MICSLSDIKDGGIGGKWKNYIRITYVQSLKGEH
jgi:hypothetical protein